MLADEKAGISEHSVVFPIDSIKVSRPHTQLAQYARGSAQCTNARPECRSWRPNLFSPQPLPELPARPQCDLLHHYRLYRLTFVRSRLLTDYDRYGAELLRSLWALDRLTQRISGCTSLCGKSAADEGTDGVVSAGLVSGHDNG